MLQSKIYGKREICIPRIFTPFYNKYIHIGIRIDIRIAKKITLSGHI